MDHCTNCQHTQGRDCECAEECASLMRLRDVPGLLGAGLWDALCAAIDWFADQCDAATPFERFVIAAFLVAGVFLVVMGGVNTLAAVSDWLWGR